MITTAHFIVGAAVGVATGNPYAGFVAGVVSHFVVDTIPHFDVPLSAAHDQDDNLVFTPALWTQVLVDGIVGLVVLAWLWGYLDTFSLVSPVLWGALGGFFPDLIDNVPFWNKAFRRTRFGTAFHRFHDSTHAAWKKTFPMKRFWWLGILTQLVTIIISLNYLFS